MGDMTRFMKVNDRRTSYNQHFLKYSAVRPFSYRIFQDKFLIKHYYVTIRNCLLLKIISYENINIQL